MSLPKEGKEGSRGAFARALRAALGVLLVVGVVYLVNTKQLLDAFEQITLFDVVVLVAVSALLIAVSVVKWRAFLRHLGIATSFEKLFSLYLVGYFVNIFTPSFIGGDVVRSLALGSTVNRAHAVAATFLERYTGIVAMLCMAGAAVCFSDVVTTPIVMVVALSVVGCVVLTWAVLTGWVNRFAHWVRLPAKVTRILDAVHEGLVLGVQDQRLLYKALLLSVLFHLLTVVNTAAVAHAVGWIDIPWRGLMVVVPLILLVGAVPLSPQGLGIQEGAFVFFLNSVGASPGQALAIALVLRAKSYVLAICGGCIWFVRREAWNRH